MCAPSSVVSSSEVYAQVTHLLYLVCVICVVCVVCVACLLTPLYPFVCGCQMCLLCSSILSCSSSPIHVDAKALCGAALSLKKLDLRVINSGTQEALARIFDLQPLEELVLFLYSDTEVSSACSTGTYVRSCEVFTLKDQLT